MYHDYAGREIEDLEGDTMRQDWIEDQMNDRRRVRRVFRSMKRSSRRVHMDEVKKQRRLRQTRQW